ncbi:MAG TPA: polyhydroxyalkanoate synthesis regulator DNA-binding domain-containing protein [Polyangiaceae bacterium LLY-WYZ-15_(1-7)]|nr:polyhydroxyalkanoate synthesis regulator DNA-binding domain-containing protein [Polyangiaceae bacterium LLY-WYZ-15_(1-7)]HJL01531.1 polyhydroxyalkanoate synthesis regulator DNA-binding domain-containing protein [Polyangiaceae bacterium LLY-WYZ-15_(1-7)]HJL13037.1 polyhydroxyalkanoate synthesis regulator DNA-binding domain-containing protein [Polyangiaceae bacterium LLY-WYZ-15_(1-7)]HJL23394.1 polyhydroxyalkanoate synthesis regulator DNA-binding domain-containing protein [Polyangiaceae bacteri
MPSPFALRYGDQVIVVKKYSNRRLYDTDQSRYITLDELAERVREGFDVRVVDAKSGDDLTQQTLAQIILESRGAGKLLPAPLLAQLIRMQEEDLAEFLGKYMSWALEVYQTAKRGASQLSPFVPFAGAPFQATNALARMMSGFGPWNMPGMQPPGVEPAPRAAPEPPPEEAASAGDVAALRAELEALKEALGKGPATNGDD